MSARKFGPTRKDLKLRLGISLVGLAMLLFAVLFRGLTEGPGGWEAVILASVFFGGSVIWISRKLILRDHPNGPDE